MIFFGHLNNELYIKFNFIYLIKMHEIIKPMMEFRSQIKLYHWKTSSFSRHKGTDKFLEKFIYKFL